MKKREVILVIALCFFTIIGLTFNSFATENPDNIITNPDISVEDNLTNNDNNQGTTEDTDTDNNETEEPSTGTEDNNTENGNNDNENTEDNNNVDNENTNNNDVTNESPSDNNNTESNTDYEQKPEKSEGSYEKPTQNNWQTNNTPTIEKKSDNTNLRKIVLDVEGLSPEFDKNITDYYLIVDLSVETVNIEAYPEDEKAIVMIDGNTNLQEGENTISITVKAESGDTKTYIINVTKTNDLEMVNANLKNLSVKGFNFYPSFKNNIYNYNLTINEKISQLEILVETEIEGATYEIIGNENLQDGDNLIKVIVTAKDGKAKREYKLNVYMSSKNVKIQETNKIPAIILLSVLGVAIIGTSIAISKKH